MCFVYNKPKVKFIHSSNHTEHYRKKLYYETRTKHDCISAQCIFNCNISFTGHKQGTVRFPQRKPLPRSTPNSTVTICGFSTSQEIPWNLWNTKAVSLPLVLSWARCPCKFYNRACLKCLFLSAFCCKPCEHNRSSNANAFNYCIYLFIVYSTTPSLVRISYVKWWNERRPVRRADNLTTFMCRLSWNLRASTSWKPQGLSRPVMGLLYLTLLHVWNLTGPSSGSTSIVVV
jgi:hypothetical protein